VVAVWGCGPVGLFAIQSALLLGAGKLVAIDRFRERLSMAIDLGATEVLDYEKDDVFDALRDITGGMGPDACIDAVGMEAHGAGLQGYYDRVKQTLMLETDRPSALRDAIHACRKGGIVSIPGVYGGYLDKVPMGAAFAKGLTLKMGQTHVHRYLRPLLQLIEKGEIDPSAIVTHRMTLDEAPIAYEIFKHKQEDCVKVVMTP
jgi:threonine dehydrogenase-like Zn-dependent dehydrogenase